jgi:hypothetical protein
MPVYCFKCPLEGHRKEVVRTVARRNDPLTCERCRQIHPEALSQPALLLMQRDLEAEMLGSTDREYAQPIYSDAMGCAPSQVAEFRKFHPNVNYADDGRVIIRSHREHKRVMKELGFFDRCGYG